MTRAAAPPPRKHRLAAAHLAEFAAGAGGSEAIGSLAAAQHSKHLLLVYSAARLTGEAVEPLARRQADAPAVASQTLRYPMVGAWAAQVIGQARGGARPAAGLLGALAAAVAVRAGLTCETEVPFHGGVLTLPSVGVARIGPPEACGIAQVRSGPDGATISAADRVITVPIEAGMDRPGWYSVRPIHLNAGGRAFDLVIDDVDPHRFPGMPLSGRLGAGELRGWARLLGAAWNLLTHVLPAAAVALTGMSAVLVPLRAPPHGLRSATSRHSFGALASSVPPDPVTAAVTLVHELQHAKMCALLDMVSLYRGMGAPRYYALWRDDPRPLGGLLHGAYAHLGVCMFWQAYRRQAGVARPNPADLELARWRNATAEAIATLARDPALTSAGRAFVAAMAGANAAVLADPLPPSVEHLAANVATAHRVAWRLRHLRPPATTVDSLARAYLAGRPAAAVLRDALIARVGGANGGQTGEDQDIDGAGAVRKPGAAGWPLNAAELALVRYRDPGRFSALSADAREGDVKLATGRRRAAAAAFRRRLAADSADVGAWAGLAVCDPALLTARPEWTAAMHVRLRELHGAPPDAVQLAGWLVSVVPAMPAAPSD